MGFCGDDVIIGLPSLTSQVDVRTVLSLKSMDLHLLVRIPGSFFGALISKDAAKASAHTTVQNMLSLDSSRSLWMRLEAVLYVHSVFGPSSILHSLWVPLVPVKCLYHYSQEYKVVYSLATAKGVAL